MTTLEKKWIATVTEWMLDVTAEQYIECEKNALKKANYHLDTQWYILSSMSIEILAFWLKKTEINKHTLQLYAVVSVMIAKKYLCEEETPLGGLGALCFNDAAVCVYLCANSVTLDQVKSAELEMLAMIDYNFKQFVPTWAVECEQKGYYFDTSSNPHHSSVLAYYTKGGSEPC